MNILDLNRSDFNAAIGELAAQGVDVSGLRQQYREKSSPFAGLFDYASRQQDRISDAGRTSIAGGLLSKPEGSTGMDAVRGVEFEPMAFLSGLLSGGAQAVDAPAAAMRGDLTRDEMVGEALGTAGVAMLGGGAMPKPKGALGANTLRVYHGTDADISQLDPSYGVTARDLYTTPARSDAAKYGKNVLEFDVDGKIGNFLPEARGIPETKILQTAYSDYGLDDYFDSFDDFVEAFDNGDMFQRFSNSAAQDEVVGALIDVGGFDAIRIPDAGFGGNMSESVVAQNPNVFKPVMANASKSAGLLGVAFDVTRKDASNIFGEGTERVRYTDPASGGTMEVVVRPDGSASVLELEVPDASRGKGIGQSLQERVMQDFPKMGGQVSSKAAAKTAYRLGRRPYGQPEATLEDVFAAIDDMSSVNLVSPQMQPSPAQEVAGLLSSGRVDDVTDEMLAKLTPNDEMELFDLYQRGATGMDLPMDEVSRMARAREMGFEGDWLHGTGSDIAAVDTSKLGEKQNVLGRGFYQTTNPERSDRYVPKVTDEEGNRVFAEGGNVMPLMTKSADEFDLTVPTGRENITRIANAFEGSDYDVGLRDGGDSVSIKSKTDPKMSVFLDSYQDGQATLMRLKDAFGRNNLTPILQEAGFTGVKGFEGSGSNVRVNYNPQDVRSQSARFDPRLAHLRNLNAANASPTAGLLSQAGMSEQQAERTEKILQRMGLLD